MSPGPPTVVVVDDHRMLRESLRRALEAAGVTVVGEAGDGEAALRQAVALRPDIVLMDVSMPVMDGVAATRRIRERVPTTRVVVLTMHADEDVVARAIRAGADAYLVKDCSVEEVVSTLAAVAAGSVTLSAGIAASMLDQVRVGAGRNGADPISRREEEVLQLIADGCATSEVAEQLYISPKTVKNHLASIYAKLDARDRTQAVVRAVRLGIIRLD